MSCASGGLILIEDAARSLIADGIPQVQVTTAIEQACQSGEATWDEDRQGFGLTRHALVGMWQRLDKEMR